jgi:hypothetical protein
MSEKSWDRLNAFEKDIAAATWCNDHTVRHAAGSTYISGLLKQARFDPDLAARLEIRYRARVSARE